jgi:hypothetical protein
MAIGTITNPLGTVSTSAGSSITGTIGSTVAVDRVALAIIGKDNDAIADGASTDVSSVTDTAGNTWEKLIEFTESPSGANTGACVSVWRARITTQLTTSDTVTANFANSCTSKTLGILNVQVAAGQTLNIATGGSTTQGVNGSTGFSGSLSGLASKEYLFLLAQACEINSQTGGATSYTTTNMGNANTGTAATSIASRSHHRVLTGTGDTPTYTSPGTADKAFVFIALEEATPAGGSDPAHLMSSPLFNSRLLTSPLFGH